MVKRKKETRLSIPKSKKGIFGVNVSLPEIVIYPFKNFHGNPIRSNLNVEYLGEEFNDNEISIVIVSGNWQFYKDANFRKKLGSPLKPGYYPEMNSTVDPNSLGISSIKCVSV